MPELVRVGRVGRPHGLDGSFVVEEASEDPRRFVAGAVLLVDGAETRVVASKRARRAAVIAARPGGRRGAVLSVPRGGARAARRRARTTCSDLVGLAVEEEGGRALGVCAEVAPGVANDVLELDSGLSLPLHEACVLEVDVAGGLIVVARGFADAG